MGFEQIDPGSMHLVAQRNLWLTTAYSTAPHCMHAYLSFAAHHVEKDGGKRLMPKDRSTEKMNTRPMIHCAAYHADHNDLCAESTNHRPIVRVVERFMRFRLQRALTFRKSLQKPPAYCAYKGTGR
jgi:hypothetical protein